MALPNCGKQKAKREAKKVKIKQSMKKAIHRDLKRFITRHLSFEVDRVFCFFESGSMTIYKSELYESCIFHGLIEKSFPKFTKIKRQTNTPANNEVSVARYFNTIVITWFHANAMGTIHNIKNENAKNVYDRPYSLWENKVDTKLLGRNTGLLVGVSVATMGILYMMPTSFTNWEDDDDKKED